jgi:hypothetical protein
VAVSRAGDSDDFAARELAAKGVDHVRLANLAMRSRLSSAFASWLLRHDLIDDVPYRLARVLEELRIYHRHRQRTLAAEALRVCAGLDAAGLRYAVTKGIPLQAELYPEPGVREINDIDLMAEHNDGAAIQDTLIGLGFSARKEYRYDTDSLVDLPRADLLNYLVSPDHLPHLRRIGSDGAVPSLAVDVAFSLTWHNAEWEVPVDEALGSVRRVPVDAGGQSGSIPALGHPYAFAFVVLHLFREGWFQRTAERKDLNLSQFTDVARYWAVLGAPDRAEFGALVVRHGLADPVAWVAHHTDVLFGTDIVTELDLRPVAMPSWIASGRGHRDTDLLWSGDIDERLVNGVAWLDRSAPVGERGAVARR